MINYNPFGQRTLLSSSIITAFAPMLCCWGPSFLVGVAGLGGGVAIYFSWIHPVRPYLFAFAFVLLGFSFYRTYRSQNTELYNCDQCSPDKTSFFRSKLYVWMTTVFVVTMFIINYFFPELLH